MSVVCFQNEKFCSSGYPKHDKSFPNQRNIPKLWLMSRGRKLWKTQNGNSNTESQKLTSGGCFGTTHTLCWKWIHCTYSQTEMRQKPVQEIPREKKVLRQISAVCPVQNMKSGFLGNFNTQHRDWCRLRAGKTVCH